MIDQKMYNLSKDILAAMSNAFKADEALQVALAFNIIKAKSESPKTEETMFRSLGCAALVVQRYEEQNNLHTDSPTNPTLVTNT